MLFRSKARAQRTGRGGGVSLASAMVGGVGEEAQTSTVVSLPTYVGNLAQASMAASARWVPPASAWSAAMHRVRKGGETSFALHLDTFTRRLEGVEAVVRRWWNTALAAGGQSAQPA